MRTTRHMEMRPLAMVVGNNGSDGNDNTITINIPVGTNNRFRPLTWIGQDQAVMYDPARVTYVIAGGNGPPISLNFFRVPQPILILDMPQDVVP